jgi:hypothetical protein
MFRHARYPSLTIFYPPNVIGRWKRLERPLHCSGNCNGTAEGDMDMKIYLLLMLIGTILIAANFTSASKQPSETLPQ